MGWQDDELRRLIAQAEGPARLARETLGVAAVLRDAQLRLGVETEALRIATKLAYGEHGLFRTPGHQEAALREITRQRALLRTYEDIRSAEFSGIALAEREIAAARAMALPDATRAISAFVNAQENARRSLEILAGAAALTPTGYHGVVSRAPSAETAAIRQAIKAAAQFNLDYSLQTGVKSAGLSATYESAFRTLEMLDRTGFQTVATLGDEGLAAKGAASDILAHYTDEPDAQAPIFSAVRAGVVSLDGADPHELLAEVFAQLPELIAAAVAKRDGYLTLSGLVALIGLLIAAASLAVGVLSYQGDERERSTPATAKIEAQLATLIDAQEREATATRSIRYVHQRAWLRTTPSKEGQIIRAIYPDQPLNVLEASDSWAKVEAFDYASDTPIIGWISRRHLRVMPPH